MQSRTLNVILAVSLLALISVPIWHAHITGAENFALQHRVAELSRDLAVAKMGQGPCIAPAPRAVSEPASPAKSPQPVQSAPRKDPSVPKLNEDLASARARISELESKVLSLEADRATLAQQRQQELTAAEDSCRSRVADVQRALEAAQTDLKAAQQHAALFETENANLRKAQAQTSKSAASLTSGSSEIDELSRRRETYLKNLFRRFREIDTEYRTIIRDPQGARSNDAALLQIQNTLAQAEDDIRQIDSLTAKTLLVEKRKEKN
jgi:hypothetical protein